jgi:hypothetical protein
VTWIVMTSSAGNSRGAYRNIALVELAPDAPAGYRPKRIDVRGKHIRSVDKWGRFFVGKTNRASYYRVLREADAAAAMRNA